MCWDHHLVHLLFYPVSVVSMLHGKHMQIICQHFYVPKPQNNTLAVFLVLLSFVLGMFHRCWTWCWWCLIRPGWWQKNGIHRLAQRETFLDKFHGQIMDQIPLQVFSDLRGSGKNVYKNGSLGIGNIDKNKFHQHNTVRTIGYVRVYMSLSTQHPFEIGSISSWCLWFVKSCISTNNHQKWGYIPGCSKPVFSGKFLISAVNRFQCSWNEPEKNKRCFGGMVVAC